MKFPKMQRKEGARDDLLALKNIEVAQQESLSLSLPGQVPTCPRPPTSRDLVVSRGPRRPISTPDCNVSHNLNWDEEETSKGQAPNRMSIGSTHNPMQHRQSIRRGSMFFEDKRAKKTKEKPTYQLGPFPGYEFSWLKAKNIVESVTRTQVAPTQHLAYDAAHIAVMLKVIAGTIMKKLKHCDFPRYKYVCQTTSVQLLQQGGQMASRHLWAPDTDRCFHLTKHCKDFIIVISLYAMYYE